MSVCSTEDQFSTVHVECGMLGEEQLLRSSYSFVFDKFPSSLCFWTNYFNFAPVFLFYLHTGMQRRKFRRFSSGILLHSADCFNTWTNIWSLQYHWAIPLYRIWFGFRRLLRNAQNSKIVLNYGNKTVRRTSKICVCFVTSVEFS